MASWPWTPGELHVFVKDFNIHPQKNLYHPYCCLFSTAKLTLALDPARMAEMPRCGLMLDEAMMDHGRRIHVNGGEVGLERATDPIQL